MLRFAFTSESSREDVLSSYAAIEKNGVRCIGCKYGRDYALRLTNMQNRRAGKNFISATAGKIWWAYAA